MQINKHFEQIFPYLPRSVSELLEQADRPFDDLEELRLKPLIPPLLRFSDGEAFLCEGGRLSPRPDDGKPLTCEEMRKTVLLLTDSSFYALEEELRRGYITLPGGHRAGLCGHAILQGGAVRTLRDVSSVNIRVAGSVIGAAAPLLPRLLDSEGRLCHTLLVSPPGAGKTTLLRDIARAVSDGDGVRPMRVGMVDERSELAAIRGGIPQLPVGVRTDVLDGCPKAEGIGMLLRSMSPELLVCDEIGRAEDAAAIRDAINGGVRLLVSAHGGSRQEITSRPVLAELMAEHAFRRIVLLSRRNGPGTVEWISEEGNGSC